MEARLSLALIFLLPAAFGAPAPAAKPKGALEALVEEALARNPEIAYYEGAIGAAKGQVVQARIVPYPQIEGFAGPWYSTPTGGGTAHGWMQEYAIYQPVFFPGKMSLAKAIAEKDVRVAELGLQQFRLSLATQVRTLAYRLGVVTANARIAREIAERAAGLVDFLRRRPATGVQGYLDLRILEGSLVDLQRLARELEQNRRAIQSQINALRARPAAAPVPDTIFPPAQAPSLDLASLQEQAKNRNYALLMRQTEIDRAARSLDAAKLAALPDFSVGPFWIGEKGTNFDQGPGLVFTSGLPFWNDNKGNILTAEAQQRQAEALHRSAIWSVQSAVAAAFGTYLTTRRQLGQQPHDVITRLQRAAELADRQYRLGAIPVQTFLEMQRQYLSSAQALYTAALDLQTALLDLENLTAGAMVAPR
ncbi:TolC family protein [Methylacidimicrobium sp. AP8]|uniref:TolC family protein n=1 Tax=Methylacidimicrobium sp. AP8 TaxID=2730359 RepID=UPI001F0164FA|nr:TolC family protein [Methylacidimicrobium sp. AP8]